MAVNGFLQFAGESTNIITDEEYAESSVRVNGVTSGKAVSTLHNKMYLQWSTIAYVIGQLIADAGYAASDSDVDVLLGNLKNAIGATVGGKIFVAYYGTTTYSEVESAINSGKIVFVHDIPAAGEETLYVYEYRDNSNVYFSSAYSKNNTEGSFGWLKINVSNTWTKGSADAMIKGVDYITAGKKSNTTLGTKSTAEGYNVTASGSYAHAEGYNTEASSSYAHAEGESTKARNNAAHAEGYNTIAAFGYSHAEGYETTANAAVSHAEGMGTIAEGAAQHVGGKYNIADSTSLEIIGNGTSDNNRSNARTLDRDGNEVLAGKLTLGVEGTDEMDAATVGRVLQADQTALAAYVTDSASGSIASFGDGANNIPMKSFVASIEPIQNLNGQSAPYPAGCGKNKVDADTVFASYKTEANTYQAAASDFSNIDIFVSESLVGTECTFSAYLSPNESTSNFSVEALTGGTTYHGNVIAGGSSGYSSVTFTPEVGYALVRLTYDDGGSYAATVKNVQLEIGSSRTAFAPYSNICSISGHNGVNAVAAGVNLFDEVTELGSISDTTGENTSSSTTIRSKNYIPCRPNIQLYVKGTSGANFAGARFYDAQKNFISSLTAGNTSNKVITTPNSCCYLRLAFISGYGTTYNHDVSVNYPSTDTDYHAYIGTNYPATFPSEVYGGCVDLVSGAGVIDTRVESWSSGFGKSSITNPLGTVFFHTMELNALVDRSRYAETISNQYKYVDKAQGGLALDEFTVKTTSQDNVCFYFVLSDATTAAQCDTHFANNPLVAAFKVVEADYSQFAVTPAEVLSLLGQNNCFNDCSNTEVEYRADTKLYINKIIGSGSQTVVVDGGSF